MFLIQDDLYVDFFRFFSVELVVTAEQRRSAAELRHRVFSEECGFEPISTNGLEQDAYDAHAVQSLIRHRRSGRPAGCIRLILAGKNQRLPLEDHCASQLDMRSRRRMDRERDRVCEVSRFAVDPVFRRTELNSQRTPLASPIEGILPEERRCFAQLSGAALVAALTMAELHDREWLFSLMELPAPRMVKRTVGFELKRAGKPLEYRGRRAPFLITATEASKQLHAKLEPFRSTICDVLSADLDRGAALSDARGAA